jgi:hypothetical protein
MSTRLGEDLVAMGRDGYNDGLVNSDAAYEAATESKALSASRPRADLLLAVDRVVDEASSKYRAELLYDDAGGGLAEFLVYQDGDSKKGRRSTDDALRLQNMYFSAWERGFKARLMSWVTDRLRADLEDALACEMAK